MGKKDKPFYRKGYWRLIMLIWIGFLGIITGTVLYFTALEHDFMGFFGPIPSLESLENPKTELASEIYSADGKLMGKYYRENRSPVEYEEISPYMINALIATEDIRYESHSGIDLKGLTRAIVRLGKDGGASTITQQLAKNLYRTRGAASKGKLHDYPLIGTIVSKTKEWVTAIKIERNYTKKEIITMYLNTVEFGSNAFGIQTAARTFFDKHPSQLNVPESAILVGLLKAPTRYSPVSNPDRSKSRRNTVLEQMEKYKFITSSQSSYFKSQPIKLKFGVDDHVGGIAPYFREEAKKFLKKWAKESGRDLYSDGLRIYTTIDSRMQAYAEGVVEKQMKKQQKIFYKHWEGRNPWVDAYNVELPNFIETLAKTTTQYRAFRKKYGKDTASIKKAMNTPVKVRVFSWTGEKDTLLSPMDSLRYYKHFLHTGFMSMEPQSGHVKSWVGGINYKYFQYDHVKQGRRQPGSTFKPIVYASAIDLGYTPCHQFVDQPIVFNAGGGPWVARNATLSYTGVPMTLRRALGQSINSVTAGLTKAIGVRTIIEHARELGISSPLRSVPSLCLGSSEVSLFEMLGAYSTFVNKGKHTVPIFISRIEDRNGNIVKEFIPKVTKVLDEETAYIMLHMLRAALEPGGTSTRLWSYGVANKNEVGGKTGTTQNNSDAWFIGVTKDLVSGAWVGGDNRSIRFRSIVYGQGAVLALPMWGEYMKSIYANKDLPYTRGSFERPDKVDIELNCAKMRQKRAQMLLDDE